MVWRAVQLSSPWRHRLTNVIGMKLIHWSGFKGEKKRNSVFARLLQMNNRHNGSENHTIIYMYIHLSSRQPFL